MYDIRDVLDHYRGVNCRCVMEPMEEKNKGDNVMNNAKINWIVRDIETNYYPNMYNNLPEIRIHLVGNIEKIHKDCPVDSIASHVANLLNKNVTSPEIKKVHFNPPATVVLWADGTKTVVKTQEGEDFDPEKGLAMAIAKKAMGNQGNYYEVFKKWCYPWYAQEAKNTIVDEEFWKNFCTAMSLIGKGVDI